MGRTLGNFFDRLCHVVGHEIGASVSDLGCQDAVHMSIFVESNNSLEFRAQPALTLNV
jgi:hypothetical protein